MISIFDQQTGCIVTGIITDINSERFILETPDGQVMKFDLNMLPPTVTNELRPRWMRHDMRSAQSGGLRYGKTFAMRQWLKKLLQ